MADNVEIQGIEFAVIGETKEAIKGLDNLGATLNRIRQAAKGGLGLNAIAHEIKNFNNTLNGTNFKGLGDIEERMSNGISTTNQNLYPFIGKNSVFQFHYYVCSFQFVDTVTLRAFCVR